ncbi:MAG: hypothetical protein ACOZCL_11135 [Bacillota bacterium]
MRRIVVSTLLAVILVVFCATFVYASVNDMTIKEVLEAFIRYDFKTVKETVEIGNTSVAEGSASEFEGFVIFEPADVSSGWLYELAGGGKLGVSVGTLEFDNGSLSERYIDIKGENGQVRLLSNSFSTGSEYNKTLFWSFKQQDGASIVKGSEGEIKCAALFELSDGSYRLYGYIEGDGNDFWTLELPEKGCYLLNSEKKDSVSDSEK